jgi:hypothetical protein
MSPSSLPSLSGIEEGTTAPAFMTTNACDGNSIELNELIKKHRGVILTFFRGSW